MAELLVVRYGKEMDWDYLEKRAKRAENDLIQEPDRLKLKITAGT
ncbi:MAG: hypothetical protein ACE5LV_06245 [Candidatus Aminicenantales bacterium]